MTSALSIQPTASTSVLPPLTPTEPTSGTAAQWQAAQTAAKHNVEMNQAMDQGMAQMAMSWISDDMFNSDTIVGAGGSDTVGEDSDQ